MGVTVGTWTAALACDDGPRFVLWEASTAEAGDGSFVSPELDTGSGGEEWMADENLAATLDMVWPPRRQRKGKDLSISMVKGCDSTLFTVHLHVRDRSYRYYSTKAMSGRQRIHRDNLGRDSELPLPPPSYKTPTSFNSIKWHHY